MKIFSYSATAFGPFSMSSALSTCSTATTRPSTEGLSQIKTNLKMHCKIEKTWVLETHLAIWMKGGRSNPGVLKLPPGARVLEAPRLWVHSSSDDVKRGGRLS
jgi:hypothetical protein